jgi:hypothetical protein
MVTAVVVVALGVLVFILWFSAPSRTSKRKRLTRTVRRRLLRRPGAAP